MPPTTHSKLGASSCTRWINCPASVSLGADMPNKSSKYAVEGTAAHQLAEDCLLSGRNPHSLINGGTVTLEDEDGNQEEIDVTANMADAVFTYVAAIKELLSNLGLDEISPTMVEQSFHLDWIDEELWGTNDFMVGLPFDTLHVWDYKHGQGIAVEAIDNDQLKYYALGALGATNANNYQDVELTIVQPRAPHSSGPIRSWKISVADLYKWRDEVLVPGIAATRADQPSLSNGKHCRFCPALSVCPEVGRQALSTCGITAEQAFAPSPIKLPHPDLMEPENRVHLYEFIGQFESWAKAVREDTHEKLMGGMDIPGLKLVEGRASRKWEDADDISDSVESLLGEDGFTRKVKTPTQIEKMLKSKGLNKNEFSGQVVTTRGKTVALESDKRQAVSMLSAADAFGVNQNKEK